MVSIASPGGRVPASGALGQIGLVALVSGTVASVTSSAALALLAKAEGRNAVQPLNATSHWVHGEDAGSVREVDLDHTAVGYATHHAASVFWAFLFESLQAARATQRIEDREKRSPRSGNRSGGRLWCRPKAPYAWLGRGALCIGDYRRVRRDGAGADAWRNANGGQCYRI